MIPFRHQPVLCRETIELLNPQPGFLAVDCTVGAAGHSRAILERILPGGFLVAVDQDAQALEAAAANLAGLPAGETPAGEGTERSAAKTVIGGKAYDRPYTLVHRNFSRLKEILTELGIAAADAILMDLGVSSFQLENGARGFSYQHNGPLDMRMNPGAGKTAKEVVNQAGLRELEDIFWRYGEERWSRRIAQFIVAERAAAPIETTEQLAMLIKRAIPAGARETGPHPAKRVFQALRIYVNDELGILGQTIDDAAACLAPGGRLAVITFHSLEDRLVKEAFKKLAAGCVCPKDLPVCVCGKTPQGKLLTPKPILPQPGETAENPRARSAKLRGFAKYGDRQTGQAVKAGEPIKLV
jgi:16S rRNA (cytosine1402-N4)-methyltransferase